MKSITKRKESVNMATNSAFEIAGNMFVYKNPCCDCKIERTYSETGKELLTFLIKHNKGFYKYAYAAVDGLVMLYDKSDAIKKKKKIIEDTLSIDLVNVKSIQKYINHYGFFWPLPNDQAYIRFAHDDIIRTISRFRCLVQLIAALMESKKDYTKIWNFITPLLFEESVIFEDETMKYTPIHPFTDLWKRAFELPEHKSEFQDASIYTDETYYSIIDSFTGKTENINTLFIDEFIEVTDNSDASEYYTAKIYKLYRDGFTESDNTTARCIIDFLFNGIKDGIINPDNTINKTCKNNDAYKTRLIEIAKLVVKKEFDFHIKGIHPTYDIRTMSPNWEIPDFYSALYFSLFYTRPEYEIYRKCVNPNCRCFFKVSTTNNNKKYHAKSCQRAASQMRFRNKKSN